MTDDPLVSKVEHLKELERELFDLMELAKTDANTHPEYLKAKRMLTQIQQERLQLQVNGE